MIEIKEQTFDDQLSEDDELKLVGVTDESFDEEEYDAHETSRRNPWLLLLIGLLVGGLGGFYLRPLIASEAKPDTGLLAGVESSDQINEPGPHQAVMLAVITGPAQRSGNYWSTK